MFSIIKFCFFLFIWNSKKNYEMKGTMMMMMSYHHRHLLRNKKKNEKWKHHYIDDIYDFFCLLLLSRQSLYHIFRFLLNEERKQNIGCKNRLIFQFLMRNSMDEKIDIRPAKFKLFFISENFLYTHTRNQSIGHLSVPGKFPANQLLNDDNDYGHQRYEFSFFFCSFHHHHHYHLWIIFDRIKLIRENKREIYFDKPIQTWW